LRIAGRGNIVGKCVQSGEIVVRHNLLGAGDIVGTRSDNSNGVIGTQRSQHALHTRWGQYRIVVKKKNLIPLAGGNSLIHSRRKSDIIRIGDQMHIICSTKIFDGAIGRTIVNDDYLAGNANVAPNAIKALPTKHQLISGEDDDGSHAVFRVIVLRYILR